MTRASVAEILDMAFREARRPDIPLNERLEAYSRVLREHFPQYGDALDRLVSRLARTDAGTGAPNVGDAMPAFLLPDDQGRLVSLADLLDSGPVAVTFHRGHWCPFCRIHATALADAQRDAKAFGGQIVVITPELESYARRHKADAAADFRILSDISNGYALALNLAIWVGDEMDKVLSEGGRDIASYQGTDGWLVPIPATFVVGRDQTVKARFVDPDYRRRMETDDLVAALRAAAD